MNHLHPVIARSQQAFAPPSATFTYGGVNWQCQYDYCKAEPPDTSYEGAGYPGCDASVQITALWSASDPEKTDLIETGVISWTVLEEMEHELLASLADKYGEQP